MVKHQRKPWDVSKGWARHLLKKAGGLRVQTRRGKAMQKQPSKPVARRISNTAKTQHVAAMPMTKRLPSRTGVVNSAKPPATQTAQGRGGQQAGAANVRR